ncbi:MAG: hypothetical protein BA868_02055 [Desulfobacterales bacterium C00003106]|jgi:type IV secretion system protein TrbL|nr:MAG: hypothetical protein BA868_02055 [Desulfobacterales bacterium C00003106]
MIPDYHILTDILYAFTNAATFGYRALIPDAMYLMKFFITIEIVILGMHYGLAGDSNVSVQAIRKCIFIGFYLWLIPNFHDISRQVIESFGTAGLKAGGSALTKLDLFDPSAIIGYGLDATEPLFKTGGFCLNPLTLIMMGIGGLLILGAYFVIAWQLFLTIVEFYIVTVITVILLPFGLFKPLSFLAERAISLCFTLGIKMMIVSFVLATSYRTLVGLTLPGDATFQQVVTMFLATGSIALLCWHAPKICFSFVGGSPQLSFDDFVRSVSRGGRTGSRIANTLRPSK